MIIWDSGAFFAGLEFIVENVKKLFNFSASVLHQFWFWQRKFWRYSIPCLSLKIFFNSCLTALRSASSHYWGGSLTHLILTTCLLHIRPEGYQELHSEVGSLGPAERQLGFEPETFRLWSQHLNPLGHSPLKNLL